MSHLGPPVPNPGESAPTAQAAPTGTPAASALPSDTVVPADPAVLAAALAAADMSRSARRRAAEESARDLAVTSRRRALIVSVAVLGLLVAVVVVWWFASRPVSVAAPGPTTQPSATGPIQPTMLIQVKDSEGIAVDNALTSVGGRTGRATLITVPPDVLGDVATGGTLPVGQIARLPDPAGSANALSDAIGVNVDATVAMDTLAFSGLVDALGGVIVDVDVEVLKTETDGTSVVVIPAGPGQLLQGPQAAAYATYLAPGETQEARMARFTQVLRLVLAKLPSDIAKVESILTALGASAHATIPSSEVAAYFVRLHADVVSDTIAYKTLPVTTIDAGGVPASRINNDAAVVMVNELLPEAVRTPGPNSKVRVLVQNGVGSPGLNSAARQLLVDAGFTYVNGGNAPTFGVAASQILVPDATPESLTWGNDIAVALKLPGTAVAVNAAGQSVADVIVVLGADFIPTAP